MQVAVVAVRIVLVVVLLEQVEQVVVALAVAQLMAQQEQ
tara:strand:+ start:597 stop:713 length:117 start_codon:yes stop_codon:yes gene_type:complete